MKFEKRSFKFELRESEDKALFGYALKFGDVTDKTIYGREKFSQDLKMEINEPCYLLRDHSPQRVIGRVGQGLKVQKDSEGIFFSLDKFPETELGKETRTLIKDKILSGVSVGFQLLKSHAEGARESVTRVIDEIRLMELSIVTYPAYESSSVSARSEDQVKLYPPECY